MNRERKEQKRRERWEAAGLDYDAHLESEEAERDIDFQIALDLRDRLEEDLEESQRRSAAMEAIVDTLEAMPEQ